MSLFYRYRPGPPTLGLVAGPGQVEEEVVALRPPADDGGPAAVRGGVLQPALPGPRYGPDGATAGAGRAGAGPGCGGGAAAVTSGGGRGYHIEVSLNYAKSGQSSAGGGGSGGGGAGVEGDQGGGDGGAGGVTRAAEGGVRHLDGQRGRDGRP